MFLLIAKVQNQQAVAVHFNTSHVSINPGGKAGDQTAREDLNTSHVSINQGRIT